MNNMDYYDNLRNTSLGIAIVIFAIGLIIAIVLIAKKKKIRKGIIVLIGTIIVAVFFKSVSDWVISPVLYGPPPEDDVYQYKQSEKISISDSKKNS